MSRLPVLIVLFAALSLVNSKHPVWAQDSAEKADDVNVRYFKANLKLARHDLQLASNANRRIPNMTSKLTMIRLQNQVKYAAKLLEQAMTKDVDDLHMAHLQSVENDLDLAERHLKWAKEVSQKHSGSFRDDQLERLRLSAELARLALQRAKSPEATADAITHVQWQIDRMRSEVLSLQVEFERIRSGH